MKMLLRCLVILPLLMTGCGPTDTGDRRAAEMASRFVEQQGRQNEQSARQGHEIAAASRRLIEADAEARAKLIGAHAAMRKELGAERARLDERRRELDQEHAALELRQTRDPVIAQTILTVGTMLACLLPLLLAGYVVWVTVSRGSDDAAMTDYLVCELTAERPRLLGGPSTLQLESKSPRAGNLPGESNGAAP